MAPKRSEAIKPNTPLSSLAVLQAQLHVLHHILHSLLHTRALYPAATFTQSVLYGVQGWRSRVPGVVSHLERAIKALEEALVQGKGGRVMLVFLDGDERGTERWVFDIPALVPVNGSSLKGAPTPEELPTLLSPLVTKVIQASLALPPLEHTDDSSYTILIELPRAPDVPPAGKEGDWLPPVREAPKSIAKGVKWVGVSETRVVDMEVLVQQLDVQPA